MRFHCPLLILLVLSLGARFAGMASLALYKDYLEDLWESNTSHSQRCLNLLCWEAISAAKGICNNKAFLFISCKGVKFIMQ